MADQMKAGKYELLADRFRRTTSKVGTPHEWVEHAKGDVIELSAEEAERLKDVIAKPGEAQKQEAARLKAQADALQKQADALQAQAKDVGKGDAEPAKP